MAERYTRAALARLKGWNKSYITKLVKNGVLEFDDHLDKKIDIGKAEAALTVNKNPAYADRSGGKNEAGGEQSTDTNQPSFNNVRVLHETIKTRLLKLELEEKTGNLLNKAEVEAREFQAARACREGLQSIAGRLAAQIAGMDNAKEIEKLIDSEIREALLKLTA